MSERKEYKLTPKGLVNVVSFLTECKAKRKEILDARIDTANETEIPTVEDILSDVNHGVGLDFDGEYYNSWGVTDNYESDYLLELSVGTDLEKHLITVRRLAKKDVSEVSKMDEASTLDVAQWLDSDIAWGIFNNQTLIGYCTLGCADCCEDLYGADKDFTDDAYVLSDVYVHRQYRHQRYGEELIQNAIRETWQQDNSGACVYLSPINDYVANWYQTLGFEPINKNAMKLLHK